MGRISGFILPIGVALVVLMFATLGVLTYSTARADNNFAKRNIQYNELYYEVLGDFEQQFAQTILLFDQSEDAEEFADVIQKNISLELLSMENGAVDIFYSKNITDYVIYGARFVITRDGAEILSRGTINVDEWQEQGIKVWKGSEDGN